MTKPRWRWLAFLFFAGALAALLIPVTTGQGAEWVVTVGGGDPETVEVGARVVPLRLIVDGSEPIPAALQTRLVVASVFATAAIFTASRGWRNRVE